MTHRPLTFAIFGNTYQHEKTDAVSRLLQSLHQRGARVVIDREYADSLRDGHLLTDDGCETFEADRFEADFAVSMGGDGTLLRTAARVGAKQVPIVGVNMGRLGFLADVSPQEVEACVDSLCNGDYTVEDRALLQVTLPRGATTEDAFALNDVALLKRDTASMISIRATIDGDYLATYQADGLVVSTPTGSTAYSLSNGGPIIVPRTGVMLMTAVAPHSLNIRPIVIPDTSVIELTVESRSHSFLVAVDGRSEKLPEGITLRLCRAPHTVRIVRRSDTRYFSTLRQKMMWGADVR